MKTELIEKRVKKGQYDFYTEAVIIDTDTQGRLFVSDGWGGDDANGYCYRWRHGLVIQLKTDDTFDALAKDWNDHYSILEIAIQGQDSDRPILDWDGNAIVAVANKLTNPAAILGSIKSSKKSASSAANGAKGGRPRKTIQDFTWTCNLCGSGTHADPAEYGNCPCGGKYQPANI